MRQKLEECECISFALKNGWDCFGGKLFVKVNSLQDIVFKKVTKLKNGQSSLEYSYSLSDILASTDFWKAIAGEEMVCARCGCLDVVLQRRTIGSPLEACCKKCEQLNAVFIPAWQYRIKECIILETDKERLDYIDQVIRGVISGKN